ncbi:hypothetical protein HDU96_007524 [Phlyctochytrium bullatum]|nr:hypothetical protein HDU96_007524 [Phlyctochytrium bullatum]
MGILTRNVSATPSGDSWKITPISNLAPIDSEVMDWLTPRFLLKVPRAVPGLINHQAQKPCIESYPCNDSYLYQAAFSARFLVHMSEWTYQFLQWGKDPEDVIFNKTITRLRGRAVLSEPGKWIEVVGPNGMINMTAMDASDRIVAGALTKGTFVQYRFVTVQYYLIFFYGLVLVEIFAAWVKSRYRCHPLEPVCGLLWTLRKVSPETAAAVQGMKLSDAIDYTATLSLQGNPRDGNLVIHKRALTSSPADNTLPNSSSAARRSFVPYSSTLRYEPPTYASLMGDKTPYSALYQSDRDMVAEVRFEQDAFSQTSSGAGLGSGQGSQSSLWGGAGEFSPGRKA